MRIGLITGEYPPMRGGIADYTRTLAFHVAEVGHQIFVLTQPHGNAETSGVLIDASMNKWGFNSFGDINHWAREHRLDVLNLQYQTAAFDMSPFIHFLPDRMDVPFVTTFHDLRFPYLFPKAGPLRTWIVRHLANASDGVIVTNQEDQIALATHPRHTLIPLANALTTTEQAEVSARDKLNAKPDDLVLAHFGFVNRSKGVDMLIESMAQLRTNGVGARLLMIGERIGSSDPTNAAYADQIDAAIMKHNLQDAIAWTGYVTDKEVRAYLRTADVVVLPYHDGASYRRTSMLAALYHGCAVLTTVPAVRVDAFINGENMRMVPPGNVQALTDALIELYNNPSLRERLQHGALNLSQLFTWDRLVSDYTKFLTRIVEEFS